MKKLNILFIILVLPLLAYSQSSYKGAEIYSTQSWKYGKVDMRMRMAKGSGILSTFFTYKNGSETEGSFWEEIDIEVFGKDNAESLQTNIITGNPKEHSEEVHEMDYSLGDGYHTYTLEWTPDYVAWYLDGVEIRRSEGGQVNDLTNPQSFRMNIWAAEWEDWVGTFDTGALPACQFVNWIKYSSYTPGEGDNGTDFTEEWVDDFDSFNSSRWAKANWTFEGNLVEFSPENVVIKDGYLVLVISEEGNTGYTGSVPQDLLTPVKKSKTRSNLQIFPNPASTLVQIKGGPDENWQLFNLHGKRVMEGSGKVLNIEELPSGTYNLKIGEEVLRLIKR